MGTARLALDHTFTAFIYSVTYSTMLILLYDHVFPHSKPNAGFLGTYPLIVIGFLMENVHLFFTTAEGLLKPWLGSRRWKAIGGSLVPRQT